MQTFALTRFFKPKQLRTIHLLRTMSSAKLTSLPLPDDLNFTLSPLLIEAACDKIIADTRAAHDAGLDRCVVNDCVCLLSDRCFDAFVARDKLASST